MIKNSAFIQDEQKICKNLTPGDMFDRIINLKINCINKDTEERESFVIRSDYEMLYPSSDLKNNMPIDGTIYPAMDGKCVIRRCTQKPSIKVQCKMVSTNTGTEISVYVSNFFMLTNDGKHLRSFNNAQYTMDSVEIVMGYWGQFKNAPKTPEEFFQLRAENGADKITIAGAIVITTEKLPPDSQLRIKGFVGDIYSSPVDISQITTAEKALKNPVTSSDKNFKEVCYNLITRRYLNKHYFTDGKGQKLKTGRKNVAISDIKDFPVPVSYDKETGLMSTANADTYGVKVYLSKGAKELTLPKVKDKEGKEHDKEIYFEAGWAIGQTISRIISIMKEELNYTFNSKGDVLIYLTDEVNDPKNLYEAFDNDGLYEETVFKNPGLYDSKLPAVYNINVDAVATITCPFFTFFEPFQYIEFASRYALTSLVSYFASYSPTIYRFLIINAVVNFATVDDVNEVQITAVSSTDTERI